MKLKIELIMVRGCVITILLLLSNQLYSATPWLIEPGDKQIYFAHIYESFDRFYKGGSNAQLPDDIVQSTQKLGFEYGLSDRLMLDGSFGYTETKFKPATRGDFEGRDDSRIGITWRIVDEFIASPKAPSLAVRLGYILKGDYESSSIGNPHSPGDGESGLEASILLGKIFYSSWLLSGELGYRDRERIPSEYYYRISTTKNSNKFSYSLTYLAEMSKSGLNIGDPGVTPNDFEHLKEVRNIIDSGISYRLFNNSSISLNYAKVVGGRNTGKSDIIALSTRFSF